MKLSELNLLKENFSAEKEYIGAGYYRLKELGENEYELSFSVPGECGTSNYHPKINLLIEGEEIVPFSLMDIETNPITILDDAPENQEQLQEQLDLLVEKFKQAKNL